jgi:histidinol-phosphate aminotransferase
MATDAPAAVSLVYTWEPSNAAIARRYGLRAEDILRFDTNTSPMPPNEIVAARLGRPFEPTLNEYPDSSYEELTSVIAAYNGVEPERIVVGAGADEVLDLAAKANLAAGGAAIVPTPTYSMYAVLTRQRDAGVVEVPRLGADANHALDVPGITAALASAQVVWLCVPNNPTGTLDDEGTLGAVLDATARLAEPPTVVVDEAYFEFVDRTAVGLTDRYPNLIVVRTMSKAFALAGIRVGYAIASRPMIERLERVRPPGSISTISAALAAAALAQPRVARTNVERLATERVWLTARLREAGYVVRDSVTNFVLVQPGPLVSAEAMGERLLKAGIVPRTFAPDHPLAGSLRLTVRDRAEDTRLLEVLA